MPDVAHFRRPPIILPPMIRAMDSPTPSKKPPSPTKTSKQKSAIKLDKSLSAKEKDKEHILRY
jgi:hypothetical protein